MKVPDSKDSMVISRTLTNANVNREVV